MNTDVHVAPAVIVTGAGNGLGEGIARRLADDGYHIAVTDMDKAAAVRVAEDIVSAGGSATGYELNIADAEAISAVVADIASDSARPLYGLVNNAGVGRARAFLELSEQDWDLIFTVNVKGMFLMTQKVLPHMIANGRGGVVNIASIAGKEGFPMQVAYGSSKHAVIGMTRGLAKEIGYAGVRVNAVCPGAVKTAMWSAENQGVEDADSVFDQAISKTALRVPQTAEDIAAAVAFLLSDQSAKITGVSLSVDSGLVLS